MTTVKTLLETKFNEFVTNVKEFCPQIENSLKEFTDIDHLEVLDVVLFLFPDEQTSYHLDQFLDLKHLELSDENKQKILPFLETYLTFLRKIKKLL